MNRDAQTTVLVLCTGNSARSILGEVLINELGGGRFKAHSAGSQPTGQVNPGALDKLLRAGHSTSGLSSKSWDNFVGDDSVAFDVVITVCDNAANESCPIWRSGPVVAHWGIPDPAGSENAAAAFDHAYGQLRRRIEALVKLPIADMDRDSLDEALAAIHAIADARETGS